MNGLACLNIGCGVRFRTDWTNIDLTSHSPDVIEHDVSKGLPFGDGSYDVVYHSHVLEHIDPDAAPAFLTECRRVLKAGGVLRIAVPDLERIVRAYLSELDAAATGDPDAAINHEWMVIELLDQMVREERGGRMRRYLKQDDLPNADFVLPRIGWEGRRLVGSLRTEKKRPTPEDRSLADRGARRMRRATTRLKNRLARALIGEDGWEALELGRYRQGGEIHRWMYDRVSLAALLEQVGFERPTVRGALESAVEGWADSGMDAEDGETFKPDSLFMEAYKPR